MFHNHYCIFRRPFKYKKKQAIISVLFPQFTKLFKVIQKCPSQDKMTTIIVSNVKNQACFGRISMSILSKLTSAILVKCLFSNALFKGAS
mmetsp:Transcript_17892/g.30542  ORF Transcript_17892/g.30542 Transcript_17892/m.30542 type:complete len:90 (-) Transcript_17892:14-283(-)